MGGRQAAVPASGSGKRVEAGVGEWTQSAVSHRGRALAAAPERGESRPRAAAHACVLACSAPGPQAGGDRRGWRPIHAAADNPMHAHTHGCTHARMRMRMRTAPPSTHLGKGIGPTQWLRTLGMPTSLQPRSSSGCRTQARSSPRSTTTKPAGSVRLRRKKHQAAWSASAGSGGC